MMAESIQYNTIQYNTIQYNTIHSNKGCQNSICAKQCPLYSSLLLILEARLSLNVPVISLILCINRRI